MEHLSSRGPTPWLQRIKIPHNKSICSVHEMWVSVSPLLPGSNGRCLPEKHLATSRKVINRDSMKMDHFAFENITPFFQECSRISFNYHLRSMTFVHTPKSWHFLCYVLGISWLPHWKKQLLNVVNRAVKWFIKHQIGSIKLQDTGWKERAVVRESQLKYLQLLFTSTNDMLNNHISDLIMQNLKRLFADLHI